MFCRAANITHYSWVCISYWALTIHILAGLNSWTTIGLQEKSLFWISYSQNEMNSRHFLHCQSSYLFFASIKSLATKDSPPVLFLVPSLVFLDPHLPWLLPPVLLVCRLYSPPFFFMAGHLISPDCLKQFHQSFALSIRTLHSSRSALSVLLRRAHPLMVLQIILEGARKWMGPFLGCVFIRFLKNRSYLAFCLTSPPEMHISSHLTITYMKHYRDSEYLPRYPWEVGTKAATCLAASAWSGWICELRRMRDMLTDKATQFAGEC